MMMISKTDGIAWLLLAVLLTAAGCRKDDAPRGDAGAARSSVDPALARRGQEIFRNRDFGTTGIACADCHSEADESIKSETRIYAGHSIVGAARRVSTWNGEFTGQALTRTAAGAAKCARIYLERGPKTGEPLTSDETRALMAYYEAISTGNEAARIEWTAVTWPGNPDTSTARLNAEVAHILAMKGDAPRGEQTFAKACGICHGRDGLGVGPSYRTLRRHLDELPEHVRAGYKNMPFFARDRLSDADIADIRAYLETVAR